MLKMEQVTPTEEEILKMMAKRDRLREYGVKYRAEHKEALLAYNREYFEKNKGNPNFVIKQRESISISKKKRRMENKKGTEAKPIRQYKKKT
jgi:hypothetical protein